MQKLVFYTVARKFHGDKIYYDGTIQTRLLLQIKLPPKAFFG